MQSKTSFNLWYALVMVLTVLVLQGMWGRAVRMEQIPYSQFQAYLAEDRVDEVRISRDRIQGKLRDPVEGEAPQFITVRVDDKLAETLAQHNVRFAGEIENTFVRDLLSWMLPVVLFVALWMFLIRRMMGKNGIGGGFMSIGKSKAKIYMELTFDSL